MTDNDNVYIVYNSSSQSMTHYPNLGHSVFLLGETISKNIYIYVYIIVYIIRL